MHRRQDAEARVPAEELVSAGADERDRQAGLTNGLRNVVRDQAVEGRLIQRVDSGIERGGKLLLGQEDLAVRRADGCSDGARELTFVVLLLLEGQGEGVHGSIAGTLGKVGDGAGIDAARQKNAQWHV